MPPKESEPFQKLNNHTLYAPPSDKGTVFPGKPYLQNNQAVQRSLMEIFDEFTTIISGELKTLNMTEFEKEAQTRKRG